MILFNIRNHSTYHFLENHIVLQQAFTWILENAHTASEGIVYLRGKEMFVNVHGYETLPHDQCFFESHRKYIDLQYAINGGELIEWLPASQLTQNGSYDHEKDFQYYHNSDDKNISLLRLTPGVAAIFFPEDAHKPKLYDRNNREIWKLVVKISMDLFGF